MSGAQFDAHESNAAWKPAVSTGDIRFSGVSQTPRDSVELQKLLIDERIRCETHKTNYQTLKEEHKRLQDEHIKLQEESARMQNTKDDSSDHLQAILQSLEAQLAAKTRELEEVRSQTIHPSKLEIIKAEIAKELEEPLKAHMLAMDKEVEKYRSDYNKMRYEHTFLKAEYDHAKAEHHRKLEEQKLRYHALMSALQQERDDLLQAQKSSTDVDGEKLLRLQRQKTQLEQRVRNLLDETAELQKLKEQAVVDADSLQRSQAKQIAQLQASLKSIESEKRSIDMHCERLRKELQESNERNTRLNQRVQELNKECVSLKNMTDEDSHKHKVALTNQKLEALKTQGNLERERDSLINKTHNLETELDILRSSSEHHQKMVEEMERESCRKVEEAREEEWHKNDQLQHEKVQLEEKCRELEQRLEAEKASRLNDREEFDGKIRANELNDAGLRSEISQLKVGLEHELRAREQSEADRKECANLRQKTLDLDRELQSEKSARQAAVNEAERAKEAIRDVRSDAEAARNQAQRAQAEAEKSIDANQLIAMEEKHRMQTRIDQLEHKLKRNTENQDRTNKHQKKVKHLLVGKVRHLKHKVELLEAEKEKLEIEQKAGRHGVSLEEHNKMRRRLRDLKRRHHEFRHVIGMGESITSINGTTLQGDMTSFGFPPVNLTMVQEQENRHQKDLSLLRQRLDEIAMQQKEQMEAMDAVDAKRKISVSKKESQNLPEEMMPSNLPVPMNDDGDNNKTASGRYDYEDDFSETDSNKTT